MKLLAAFVALLIWQGGAPVASVQTADRQYLRYERAIAVPAAGQSCVVLDAATFAHASASLKDLRVYSASAGSEAREVPYAITLSEPVQPDSDSAAVLNLGQRGKSVVFDLAMPARPYTEVTLDLTGQDFLATAVVSGEEAPNSATTTRLGEFTLFDLSSQRLSRNTTIHLQESNFRYLRVELTASAAVSARPFTATPEMVRGASVPPSREAQSLFTLSAETRAFTQRGKQTVATLMLPQRVPVERVSFEIASDFKGNFSRDVVIADRPEGTPASAGENINGTILRVRLNQGGREIRQQELSVPATLGSNLQGPASVEVAVNNGDDAPLPITAVQLEMRERQLCFDAPAAGNFTLFYGDSTLEAPVYDYARIFSSAGQTKPVELGPEQANPDYRERPDTRPMTERNPQLVWVALLVVICVLALVALRSSKNLHRQG